MRQENALGQGSAAQSNRHQQNAALRQITVNTESYRGQFRHDTSGAQKTNFCDRGEVCPVREKIGGFDVLTTFTASGEPDFMLDQAR
jgi:hypothetical protein